MEVAEDRAGAREEVVVRRSAPGDLVGTVCTSRSAMYSTWKGTARKQGKAGSRHSGEGFFSRSRFQKPLEEDGTQAREGRAKLPLP